MNTKIDAYCKFALLMPDIIKIVAHISRYNFGIMEMEMQWSQGDVVHSETATILWLGL